MSELVDRITEVLRQHNPNTRPYWGSWDEWASAVAERIAAELAGLPPLEDDRTAMMLGLVPDKRTPQERLLDAIKTNGESLRYRYEPLGDSDGGNADAAQEGKKP